MSDSAAPSRGSDCGREKSRAGLAPRRRALRGWMAILLLLGASYRVAVTLRLPVGYDEVFVVAVGLEEMAGSRASALLETPMQRSSALAPLWWWVEYGAYRLAGGEITLPMLRAAPLLLSLALPIIGYRCAARRFGRGTAVVFAGLLALSDIATFCMVRCDFFEALFLLFLVPAVCSAGDARRPGRRGLLWAGMGLTFLGKALFAIGLNIAAELAVIVWMWRAASCAVMPRRDGAHTRLRGLLISSFVAAVPVGAWLTIASMHYAGGTIPHEAMAQAPGVVALIRGLTIDYAQTKAHVVGTPLQAALVWLDADVWPINALSLGAMLAACAAGMALVLRGAQGHDEGGASDRRFSPVCTRRGAAMIALLVWSVGGAAYVITRGATGARFHLMYLPALWLVCACAWEARRARRKLRGLPFVVMCAAAALPACGWISWSEATWSATRAMDRMLPIAVAAGLIAVAATTLRRPRFVAPSALAGVAVASWAAFTAGPAWWGPAAKFEPMFQKDPSDATRAPYTESMQAVDNFRGGRSSDMPRRRETLEVLLSNYYRTRRPPDFNRATGYALRATEYQPGDVLAWTYLGLALDEAGASAAKRREAWERAYSLKPESALIQERLLRLDSEGAPK